MASQSNIIELAFTFQMHEDYYFLLIKPKKYQLQDHYFDY